MQIANHIGDGRIILQGQTRSAFQLRRNAVQVKAQTESLPKLARQESWKEPPPVTNSQNFNYRLPDMSQTVLGIILGGGAGTRLKPLTLKRAKPAVPLGANYRLIDIPVSNCLNSNINKIYCLTQFNSASLNRHITMAFADAVNGIGGGFVEVLAASQSPQNTDWFQGTSDAVRRYLWLFEQSIRDGVEDFVILAGDHLYRCNYQDFVRAHRESGADITVSALPCAEKQASAFGLMKIDETGRITEFAEKPSGDALRAMQVDTTVLGLDPKRAADEPYIASMGIYVIKASAIKKLLQDEFPEANDFGSEIIPGAKQLGMNVQAYLFDGYWEDIGTIEAFFNANLALTDPTKPKFSFYDKTAPIYTMSRYLPPCKILDAKVEKCVLGDGCLIMPGSTISHAVLGVRTVVSENCDIQDALIMGSDYYERPEECDLMPGCLPMGIGANTVIKRAIVDKNARIGPNCQLINKDGVQEAQRDNFWIRDGITVVIKDAVIPAGTII